MGKLSKFYEDLLFKGWFMDLTVQEAKMLSTSGWWEVWDKERVAEWQLNQALLSMPFDVLKPLLW